MLTHLKIRDLVLIEELDLEISPGFNVLTGETGAGKSLIVTALDLLLGKRAQSGLVRKGADEAEIEGLFDIADEPDVKKRLKEAGLPAHEDLLIRRIIPAKSRHRCYINGKLASLGVLTELANGLASVMGQHEHHSLFDSSEQLTLLDGFGRHEKRLASVAAAHAEFRECNQKLRSLKDKAHDRMGRLDYIQFQLKEITDLDPKPGEQEALEREIDVLKHQEILLETTRNSADDLYEKDNSIYERIGKMCHDLEAITQYDETLSNDAKQLAEASILIEETARSLASYNRNMDTDPERLEALNERHEELKRLIRKHGTDLEGVLSLHLELAAEAETLQKYEDSLSIVENNLNTLENAAWKLCALLTKERVKSAVKLSKAVTSELAGLSFERAEFKVEINTNRESMSATGADTIEFTVALNPGEGTHPLRKVASGGELSRMMLGIKRVLAGVGPVGTYVFDEVDAGISGAVATAVGMRLKETSAHHQVICITHLPQISAMAGAHFHVSKQEKNGRTTSMVTRLNEKQRIDEVARMLGGERTTPTIKAAAKELFNV